MAKEGWILEMEGRGSDRDSWRGGVDGVWLTYRSLDAPWVW